jgi:uncharacterized membrane-anchored protein
MTTHTESTRSRILTTHQVSALLLFAGCIAAIAIAHLRFRLNAVIAFWTAGILNRPLGASLGDLLSQPSDNGGLRIGTMWTTVLFLAGILSLVTHMALTRKDATALPPRGRRQRSESQFRSSATAPSFSGRN